MVERAPQTKQDEQYPLLKVDGGGGDGGVHQQALPTVVAPGWGVTCTSKSWLVRWPEYVSACWMTLILLGISFTVFYALSMEAYRRQPVLILKCNSTKPASDVYYHHIVQRGSSAPFTIYADYLSEMATQYPSLHFHVFFLVDDSLQTASRGPRHTRFFNKMIPYSTGSIYPFSKIDDFSKREIADFETRYQNVNVTIISLSKYMAMTPLRYKWRTIPLAYIPFYARVFSVWQTGGVAMDLINYNNNFNSRKCVDRRIAAILKQHNDGIKVDDYSNALKNMSEGEEESEIFSILYGLMHQIFNETRTFLTRSLPFPQITSEKSIIQNESIIPTNRNKRDVSINDTNKKSDIMSKVYVQTINSVNDTDLKKNVYQTLPNSDANDGKLNLTINATSKGLPISKGHIVDGTNKTAGLNKSEIKNEMLNKSETRQVVLFYDFSVFSDGIAPYLLPEPLIRSDFRQNMKSSELGKAGKYGNNGVHFLSIDSDGMFVAASSRLHPFLGHLISAGCQRMHPKFAIDDTFLTQCSGIFKEDTYCNNIFIL